MSDLQPHLPLRSGATAKKEVEIPYAINFNYLRRDWSGSEASETELAAIETTLRGLLAERPQQPEHALVLGAGAGRTAWDLCSWIPQVTAVDLSYTMAGLLDRVLDGPFEFHEVNRCNTLLTADLVRQGVARLPDESVKSDRIPRFRFAVADARHLPLANASVDAVFSVFFTDVLPLEQWIGEIKRVLKPGGVLVHFGPLDYHFADFVESLSAEELRERLAFHGLPITRETVIQTTHLATSGQMSRQLIENWAFAAENRNPPAVLSLAATDLLSVPHPVRYEDEANGGGSLILPDGSRFECGPGVPGLLELIDGQRRVQDIVEFMISRYEMDHESAGNDIIETLLTLIEHRIVIRDR